MSSLNRVHKMLALKRSVGEPGCDSFAIEPDEDQGLLRGAGLLDDETAKKSPTLQAQTENNFHTFVISFRQRLSSPELEQALLNMNQLQFDQLKGNGN